jgi:hypothetical protein
LPTSVSGVGWIFFLGQRKPIRFPGLLAKEFTKEPNFGLGPNAKHKHPVELWIRLKAPAKPNQIELTMVFASTTFLFLSNDIRCGVVVSICNSNFNIGFILDGQSIKVKVPLTQPMFRRTDEPKYPAKSFQPTWRFFSLRRRLNPNIHFTSYPCDRSSPIAFIYSLAPRFYPDLLIWESADNLVVYY